MSNNNEIAMEFISAYYNKLAYAPNDLPKFYNQEKAIIWRQSMESPNGIPFIDAKKDLTPHIARGSKISVMDYNILNVGSGFILNVFGKIESEITHKFVQTFFIETVEGDDSSRTCVISDSFKYDLSNEEEEALQLTEIPQPKRQYKRKKNNNKFVYKSD
ncbi:hypothetical protein GPJ56_004362 [Histomonas meleagridis]|uniref:uncharacterized protein n=1 Tax=Histomonas meleagridis TaxID=135588 RepID=UPI0035595FF2|nr:hypothetical protein GPJ56_004362 [Histomonas meleagridis]KAH0799993.1 hypothetical protein GO595_007105 [Histomonas meleagridis]